MYDAQIEMCKPCQTASFRFTTLFALLAYFSVALNKRNSRGFYAFFEKNKKFLHFEWTIFMRSRDYYPQE